MDLGKRLLEQAAQSAKVSVDFQQFPAGLLIFPTDDPVAQADPPHELGK